jgi:type IV pilus assembly protein PilX
MTQSQLPRSQRGIALVVVLILLVVMSLLAILSLRSTLMEERMSANMMDRSLSFQAAEAALREGETVAAGKQRGDAACTNAICNQPVAANAPRWTDNAVWAAARTTSVNLGNRTAQAQFFVEYLADNVPARGTCTTTEDVSPDATCTTLEWRYRITARSTAAGRATVMLQTTYAVP